MPPLPRVLAGPIVRRVEPTSCAFWIALSEPASVIARVWEGTRMAGASAGAVEGGELSFASSEATDLLKCGDHLYIGVIQIQLAEIDPETGVPRLDDTGNPIVTGRPAFTPGMTYSYDLVMTGTFGTKGLRDEGLLADHPADGDVPRQLALGYITDRLPSFVALPGAVDQLRLVHGSCRKSNGSGFDALAWLDDVLEDSYANIDGERPQQLYLTGDQIYADDVGACLLPMLNSLAQDLIGPSEMISVNTFNDDGSLSLTKLTDATIANFPALRRRKLVRKHARMSTTSCDNHLLSFGEFAAMYLAAWSPRAWRALATNDQLFRAVDAGVEAEIKDALTDWEACYDSGGGDPLTKWREAKAAGVDRERERVIAWRDAVPRVARALANISTLMIFDDHEITDDWNLNKRWRNRALRPTLGIDIMLNGMMAYGLFQGWGNDPVEFNRILVDGANKKDGRNKEFLKYARIWISQSSSSPETDPDEENSSFSHLTKLLALTDATGDDLVKWHYQVPGPRHLTVVMDSRTRRKFRGEGIAPPSLLGDTLKKQIPEGPFGDAREVLILVAPAPVLGPNVMDQLAAPIYEAVGDFKYGFEYLQRAADDPCSPGGTVTGVEDADAEGWAANEPAREELLKRIAPFGKVVILSGDVHYGCSLAMDFWTKNKPTPARIIQLTSSALRNSFDSRVEAVLRSNALLQAYQRGVNPERLAWDDKAPITLPPGAEIKPGRRSRMRRKPSLLPTRNWPAGTTIPPDKEPDWRWRIALVRDERPNTAMPLDVQQPMLDPSKEVDPAVASNHLPAYRAIAARHQIAAQTGRFLNVRQMVFTTNIGLVEFSGSGATMQVKHTLLSRASEITDEGEPNTIHTISLAPTSEPAPTLQSGS
ncbi:hypothetical protein [Aggregatilinea lenta]|uniref:hypothetical protein n=1 Tax=Aggregatilinea lenta TaxID=913108 RepID=UPI000E5B45BC|nr:hypothetical protein [Aggregatilinea lenta]